MPRARSYGATLAALILAAVVPGTSGAAVLQIPELPKLPGVEVPGGPPLPAPELPQVVIPDLPKAPAPVPEVRAPAAPDGVGGGSITPGGLSPGARGPSGQEGGSGQGSSTSSSAGGGAGSRAGDPRLGGPRGLSQPEIRHRRAARESRLRREVRRLSPCITVLSGLQRKVIIQRVGLGGQPPRSRRATAMRLDVSLRRVVRAERRGLRRLAAADRRTGCGARPFTGGAEQGEVGGLNLGFSEPPQAAAGLPDAASDETTGGGGLPFPAILLLAALALGSGAAVLRMMNREPVAVPLQRFAERADDWKHESLVASVKQLLGDYTTGSDKGESVRDEDPPGGTSKP